MKAIHDNAFPLDDDKKHLEIGCWFACASCGTRTNEDFECICWTKHNWDGTILEDSNWKDNESLIPSYLNPDAVIQDTAQLCSDIAHRDLEVWNLWEIEYIIWWQIKKTKINIEHIEKITKWKTRVQLLSQWNMFRCVIDRTNSSINNFQELRWTKKSKFTKKTWKKYKPSQNLVNFLQEKLF